MCTIHTLHFEYWLLISILVSSFVPCSKSAIVKRTTVMLMDCIYASVNPIYTTSAQSAFLGSD